MVNHKQASEPLSLKHDLLAEASVLWGEVIKTMRHIIRSTRLKMLQMALYYRYIKTLCVNPERHKVPSASTCIAKGREN